MKFSLNTNIKLTGKSVKIYIKRLVAEDKKFADKNKSKFINSKLIACRELSITAADSHVHKHFDNRLQNESEKIIANCKIVR